MRGRGKEEGGRIRRLFSIALLSAAAACDATGANPLLVTATVTPAAFKAGDTTTVRVVITNVSSSAREIDLSGCPYRFVVLDKSGAKVGPQSLLCAAILITKTLAPNDSLVLVHRWDGQADAGDFRIIAFLPPGDYTLFPQGASGAQLARAGVSVTILQ